MTIGIEIYNFEGSLMEETYKTKIREIEKQNLELRKKIKSLEDALLAKLGLYQVFNKNIENHIKEFISSLKSQLKIMTLGVDKKSMEDIRKLADEGKRIQIIISERHQIVEQDLKETFDQLQTMSSIKCYTSGRIRANVLIKDNEQVLISSARMVIKEQNDFTNFCIVCTEKQIIEQFENYFMEHLPQFLR